MNFKLLNDTICGEPRLVAIIDDMDKSLEDTTRAVFPAARICIDTQNDRNRMIVLIDHASDSVKKIAENFFMKPDSTVTTRVVAVPYTEALQAKKPETKAAQENEVQQAETTSALHETPAVASKQTTEEVAEDKQEQPMPEAQEKETPISDTQSTKSKDATHTEGVVETTKPKKKGSWEIVWAGDNAVTETMGIVLDKYKILTANIQNNASVSEFYNVIKQHKDGDAILVQLNWIDALGMYGTAKKSAAALQAANAMLSQCAKKKGLYADGKQTLQNFAWLSSGFLKKYMKQQKVENFAVAYDQMQKDEQKELVHQTIEAVTRDLQTKAEKFAIT